MTSSLFIWLSITTLWRNFLYFFTYATYVNTIIICIPIGAIIASIIDASIFGAFIFCCMGA